MSKLIIDMDSYKNFFYSEHGLELMTQIIEGGDFDTIKMVAKWDKCPSMVLDKIATKYMVVFEEPEMIQYDLEMLDEVAENPKTSVKMLEKIMEFVLELIDNYRYRVYEVLEDIAKSQKLTASIAKRLYEVAVDNDFDDVVEALAENKKTPDELLLRMVHDYDESSDVYKKAGKNIIKRFKKIKEESSEQTT